MKIYVVRHGQTDLNLKKVYMEGDYDINKTGIMQAEELKDKIKDIEFDIIYCSPLLRAKHTANIINCKNKEIIIENRLKERKNGNLAGKPLESIDRETYWNYYSNIRFGTEELIQDFFERVYNFIDELKNKNYDKVLIVTHSGVTKVINTYFNGIPKDGKIFHLGLENGEVKEYNTDKD